MHFFDVDEQDNLMADFEVDESGCEVEVDECEDCGEFIGFGCDCDPLRHEIEAWNGREDRHLD